MSSPMMSSMTGTFTGMGGKNVSGYGHRRRRQAMLSDFHTDEGPDLHVYLTNGTDEAAVMASKQISAIDPDQDVTDVLPRRHRRRHVPQCRHPLRQGQSGVRRRDAELIAMATVTSPVLNPSPDRIPLVPGCGRP